MSLDETVKLSIQEAISIMGCSNATVYNRIKRFKWKHEQDDEGRAWIWIPLTYLEKFKLKSNLSKPLNEAPLDLAIIIKRQEEMEERFKKQEQNIALLNRELEARGNALVKYREQEKDIQAVISLVQELSKKLEALQVKRPWWRFW